MEANLHVLAATTVQSRQFFASSLGELYFELKNRGTNKNSKITRDTFTNPGLTINPKHGPVQSRETVPLKGNGREICRYFLH
jgi:hypothetical protein